MLKLWIRVGVLAIALAAVIAAKLFLSDFVMIGTSDRSEDAPRAFEVETQAAGDASGEEPTKRQF